MRREKKAGARKTEAPASREVVQEETLQGHGCRPVNPPMGGQAGTHAASLDAGCESIFWPAATRSLAVTSPFVATMILAIISKVGFCEPPSILKRL